MNISNMHYESVSPGELFSTLEADIWLSWNMT